ncbi:MAG: hypothetical protein LUQ67_05205, partial [Methanomicrobiales archaeon]|nr:hypothetical protein [Methanomicrobiales archaeon]
TARNPPGAASPAPGGGTGGGVPGRGRRRRRGRGRRGHAPQAPRARREGEVPLNDWLARNFPLFPPDRATVLAATRHLSGPQRKNLFSPDPGTMKTAEGKWYESIIYETILRCAAASPEIRQVVSKGPDARYRRLQARLGQNGLFYSRSGDIKVRGNGQDLAELDLLLVGEGRSIVFGEIVTSPAAMKELETEILYKKRLMGYLFGQGVVPALLVSSVDISRISAVRRILEDPTNLYLSTATCEQIKRLVTRDEVMRGAPRVARSPKLVEAPDLPLAGNFDYRRMHDLQRSRVFSALASGTMYRGGDPRDPATVIVKKILLGALEPGAVNLFSNQVRLTYRGKPITPQEIRTHFAKIILTVNLPEAEPIIYMKPRDRNYYLKMVRVRPGQFKFESNRSRKMLGFFLWLQDVKPSLRADIAGRLLSSGYFR